MMEKIKSLELMPKYFAPSAWWEHVPIAHWLVDNIKPEKIVELGSHYGVSFFSFCEAAEKYSPSTYIYAIDTWEGDVQAGYYGKTVYESVTECRERYHKQRSSLLRCSFNEAAKYFSEDSIDILHIDGLHTYDAVKEDFITWKNKIREGGSILFHDWNVRSEDFGVWKLWEEICADESYQCISIPNGYGLGIATLSEKTPEWHRELKECLQILITKGKLLEEKQRLKEVIMEAENKMSEYRNHIDNLEEIRSEDIKHINALKESLSTRKTNVIIKILIRTKAMVKSYFRIRNLDRKMG